MRAPACFHTSHMMSKIIIFMRLCSYMTMRARGAAARAHLGTTQPCAGFSPPPPRHHRRLQMRAPACFHTSHMMSKIIIFMRLCSYMTMRARGAATSAQSCHDGPRNHRPQHPRRRQVRAPAGSRVAHIISECGGDERRLITGAATPHARSSAPQANGFPFELSNG
jgi:hypothetical protein